MLFSLTVPFSEGKHVWKLIWGPLHRRVSAGTLRIVPRKCMHLDGASYNVWRAKLTFATRMYHCKVAWPVVRLGVITHGHACVHMLVLFSRCCNICAPEHVTLCDSQNVLGLGPGATLRRVVTPRMRWGWGLVRLCDALCLPQCAGAGPGATL